MAHNYRYLNRGDLASGTTPFISKLAVELDKAQKKAPPKQWHAFIKGLATKGVKGAEIEESGILAWLEQQESASVASIARGDLVDWLSQNAPIIKEMDLGNAQYGSWRHQGDNERNYRETLYIWNSLRDCYDDRLAEIRFELEELDFNLELLAEDPDIAMRLYDEQQQLTLKRKTAEGHRVSHFGSIKDPDTGKPIVNMIAHSRTSEFGDTFFVQEIQSDWAQHGRRDEWKTIPKGPFVTSTELWTGLILRRLMQRAVQNPALTRFAWIMGSMRNGGRAVSADKLDDFYTKIMPKLADKALAGTGVKTTFMKVQLGDREFDVPGFDITDKVREKLSQSQPLYSRDILRGHTTEMNQEQAMELKEAISQAQEMLGSSVSIRLASKVLDAATGEEVAGRQIGRLLEVSLNARNPAQVVPHEAWHYAYEHLIGPLDQQTIDRAFEDGSYLNTKVRMAMVRDGAEPEAIAQCDDAREAAAHGFALWSQGKIELPKHKEWEAEPLLDDGFDRTVGRVFKKVEQAYIGMSSWIRRVVGATQATKDVYRAEEIFSMLKSGRLRQDVEQVADAPEARMPNVIRMRQRA